MTKAIERQRARRIRQEEGESIKVIARRLGVSVDSVSRWVRDIELTPEQHAVLARRNPAYGGRRKGHLRRMPDARTQRAAWQQAGRAMARDGDALHQAGCMLYWAEGAKQRNGSASPTRNVAMMQFVVRFLRDSTGSPGSGCGSR